MATTITGVQGPTTVGYWSTTQETGGEAGGSWEAVLLTVLSQLSMLLATRSGGAAGTWRHWKRERRRRRRNVIKGDTEGTSIQQWWLQLCNIVHQDRCGHRGRDKRKDMGNQKGAGLEVQNSDGAGIGGSKPFRV